MSLTFRKWSLWVLVMALAFGSCHRQTSAALGSKEVKTSASTARDSVNTSTSENPIPMSACEIAQQMIRSLDFQNWKGLPKACDWTQFTGALPTDWSELPIRPLGSSFRETRQIHFDLAGYMRPSLGFENGEAVLFEAMGPSLEDLEGLKRHLGEPAAKLDWDFGTLPLEEAEFVYPERGITLFLNSTLDRALHIALYPVTSLADYEKNLRPQLAKKLRP
jgi:hypothetical protein